MLTTMWEIPIHKLLPLFFVLFVGDAIPMHKIKKIFLRLLFNWHCLHPSFVLIFVIYF